MALEPDTTGRTIRWPAWLRAAVSVLLVLHFGLISLVYFSNNSLSRMPIADNVLIRMQPYLVGLGWYTELLPMSIVGSESFDRPVQIDYRTDRNSRTWTAWIDSVSSDARWRRLSQLAGARASNEDEEGFGLIALSLIKRAKAQGLEIDQIRFTAKDSTVKGNGLLYQATVIPLANGELTLVPSIDSTRTVPVTKTSVTKAQASSNNPAGASNPATRDSVESGAMRGTN
jgi:hypothetical protein